MARLRALQETGALTLSYVIIVPVFLAGLMVVVQTAVWFLAEQAALAAARQGLDAARVQGGSAGTGRSTAVSFARSSASGYLLNPTASSAGSSARSITIIVSGQVPVIVPLLHLPPVTARVTAPVERFTIP